MKDLFLTWPWVCTVLSSFYSEADNIKMEEPELELEKNCIEVKRECNSPEIPLLCYGDVVCASLLSLMIIWRKGAVSIFLFSFIFQGEGKGSEY